MINLAICISGLENYLLCPMQCCLNGIHISEVPKFLAESPSVTAHAIELTVLFNTSCPLINPLQLRGLISYFNVYSSNIAECENKEILEIHLTAEEPPWVPSTNEYSETY